MDFADLTDKLLIAVLSLGLGYGSKLCHSWYVRRKQTKGPRAIVRGVTNGPLIVLPGCETGPSGVFPQMSTEDVLAMGEVERVLRTVEPMCGIRIRTTEYVTEETKRDNDLVLIGSSKVNSLTSSAIGQLRLDYGRLEIQFPQFAQHNERWFIEWEKGQFNSPSSEQTQRDANKENKEIPLRERTDLTDFALLIKAPNPWAISLERKVLILAGLRGFGTWGAAQALRKSWKEIYNKLGKDKNANFAVLLEIEMRASDIRRIRICHVVDLPQLPLYCETDYSRKGDPYQDRN